MKNARVLRSRFPLILLFALISAGAACTEPPTATTDDGRSAKPPIGPSTASSDQGSPFYWYFDEKIELRMRPGRVVVQSRAANPAAAAEEVLASLGVQPGAQRRMIQAPNHFEIDVPGVGLDRMPAAVGRMRKDPRFPFASPVYELTRDGSKFAPVNRLVVKFRDGVTIGEIRAFNATFGTSIVREPDPDRGFDYYWLSYAPGSDPLSVAHRVRDHKAVEWADPDRVVDVRLASSPNDPLFPEQYYLDDNDQTVDGVPVDLAVKDAWGVSTGHWSVDVYVIDTGVQGDHPDLSTRAGYDAFTNDCCGFVGANPTDAEAHGTNVAGIVAGDKDNFTGGTGVAPNITIVPALVAKTVSGQLEFATPAQIADAVNFGYASLGVEVMNISLSLSPTITLARAIKGAALFGRDELGTAVVVAAGNTSNRSAGSVGEVTWPATMDSVVAVGAINRSGEITNYSAEGPEIDIVAPSGDRTGGCFSGGDVVTTDLRGSPGCNMIGGGDDDFTNVFSGTSAAAPQVAGAFALLLTSEGGLTFEQARSRMRSSADPWGDSRKFGHGKLNAARMLGETPDPDIEDPDFDFGCGDNRIIC